jgi:hypothetical protein
MKSKEKAITTLNRISESDINRNNVSNAIYNADQALYNFLKEIGHEEVVKAYKEVIKKSLTV